MMRGPRACAAGWSCARRPKEKPKGLKPSPGPAARKAGRGSARVIKLEFEGPDSAGPPARPASLLSCPSGVHGCPPRLPYPRNRLGARRISRCERMKQCQLAAPRCARQTGRAGALFPSSSYKSDDNAQSKPAAGRAFFSFRDQSC